MIKLDVAKQPTELASSDPDTALQHLLDFLPVQHDSEIIPARYASGRVLAQPISAQRNIPERDNSAMDGYIVLKRDLDEGQRTFKVHGEIRPEHTGSDPIPERGCYAIMTGSPIPPGDCFVIPVELVTKNENSITVENYPENNAIRRKGEGYKSGVKLLEAQTLIRPYETGLMIESGNSQCDVLKPIRISIQVTGNEITDDNNTNGPILESLIRSWPGVEVTRWPVLEDNEQVVNERLKELKASSDIIITTGGISAGKYDFLYQAFHDHGAQYLVRKINQKPGRPVSFAIWDNTLVCNLPGNPISSVFTAEWYVRQCIYQLLGLQIPKLKARLVGDFQNPTKKHLFLPGKITLADGTFLFKPMPGMKSHLLQLYLNNDGYVHLPPNSKITRDEFLTIIPFSTGLQFD